MKKWLCLLVVSFFVAGCAGGQIQDNANHHALAYAAGKAVGLSVNKFAPKADPGLRKAWTDMMEANKTVDVIPAESVVAFYNQSVLILSAEYKKDPYGLIQDLAIVLGIFGAQFAEDGKLMVIQPVPKTVMTYFSIGYNNGASRVKQFGERA